MYHMLGEFHAYSLFILIYKIKMGGFLYCIMIYSYWNVIIVKQTFLRTQSNEKNIIFSCMFLVDS